MVKQTFLSPQVKRRVIISNKLVVNQVVKEGVGQPNANDLRKLGNIRKISKFY